MENIPFLESGSWVPRNKLTVNNASEERRDGMGLDGNILFLLH